MTRKRERSEVEFLRGLVRELKSEVRNLRKQIGRSDKKVRRYEEIVTENEEQELTTFEAPKPETVGCPKCGSPLKIVDLGARSLATCEECGHRKSTPKRKK